MRPTHRTLALLLSLAAPAAARAATLALDEPVLGRAACGAASDTSVSMTWDLGTSTGASLELLGSDAAGCDETDATTAVLVDGLSTSRTAYPVSGDAAITVQDLLSAAGKATDCTGTSVRVYVCLRLLDAAGATVTTASAALRLDFTSPPAPASVATVPGEGALYVSWAEGAATTAAPADSKTYRAYASAGGTTWSSAKTLSTSARIAGLEDGTTYDVWVVAYSEAGNESAASALTTGTPQPVEGFWDVYKASGGVEQGGCGQGGGGAALWALPVLGLLVRRRPSSPPRHRRGHARGARAGMAALLLVAPAAPTLADEPAAEAAPARADVSLRLQWFRPDVDAEFGGAASPYALSIGEGRGPMVRLELARAIDVGPLALELGGGAGFHRATGRGLYLDDTGAWARSGDATALTLAPLSVFAGGRLTALRRLGVPLEPYARVSVERWQWWTSGTAQRTVAGATHGYGLLVGLALRLDDVDPASARELAREAGIRGTAITVDLSRSVIDDFGSRRSWSLGDPGWSLAGGLRLAF
ncbi:MAG: fibronectin type III domain-containing protein [Anaeromyxobacter sp.]